MKMKKMITVLSLLTLGIFGMSTISANMAPTSASASTHHAKKHTKKKSKKHSKKHAKKHTKKHSKKKKHTVKKHAKKSTKKHVVKKHAAKKTVKKTTKKSNSKSKAVKPTNKTTKTTTFTATDQEMTDYLYYLTKYNMNDYFDLTSNQQAKKYPQLTAISKKINSKQHFYPTIDDEKEKVHINHLTNEQKVEINNFAVNYINQVRKRLEAVRTSVNAKLPSSSTDTKVTAAKQILIPIVQLKTNQLLVDYANAIAEQNQKDNWDTLFHNGHDTTAIEKVEQEGYGKKLNDLNPEIPYPFLSNSSNDVDPNEGLSDECVGYGNFIGKNNIAIEKNKYLTISMSELKQEIFSHIVEMLFPSDFTEWAHAQSISGLDESYGTYDNVLSSTLTVGNIDNYQYHSYIGVAFRQIGITVHMYFEFHYNNYDPTNK